jgi:hypothetical protein
LRVRKIDGQLVSNAAQTLRLTVTAADVKKGVAKNPDACAIAVAAVRQIPGCTAAKVHKSVLMANTPVSGKPKWRRWKVPEYATREIVAFDRGGRFVPGDYEFQPVPVLPPKAQRNRSPSGRVRLASYKRRPSHVTQDVREEARKNEPSED